MVEHRQLEGAGGKAGGSGSGEDQNDTLKAHSLFRGLYVVSEGPVYGPPDANIEYDTFLNDVPIRDNNGSLNFKGMSWVYNTGLPDQPSIPGFDAAYTPVAVATKVFYGSPYTITVAGPYDAVAVTVRIPSLFKANDDGSLGGADLVYAIDIKPNGSSTWATAYQETLTNEKCTTDYERTYRVDLPVGGSPWQLRLRRVTTDSISVKLANDLYFQRYDTIIDGKFTYPNVSLLGLMLDAKQFGTQIPKVSVKWKGIKVYVPKNYDPTTRTYATSGAGTSGGIWDGTFKLAWTDNPAWIFYDIIINNRYGLGMELNPNNDPGNALIDKWNLYTISQYCDGSVADGFGGTEPRFTFNAYITTRQDAFTFLQQMSSVFRGILYFSSNQIFVAADIPDNVDAIFNQTDVKDGIFTYVGSPLKTRSSVVVVEWKNPVNNYKTEVEVVEDFDAIAKFGYKQKSIQGMGITTRGAARRLAKWLLLTEKYQTQTVTFSAGLKAGQLMPGTLIKVVDSYKSGVRWGGRLLAATFDGTNTVFTIDSPVTLSAISYNFTYVGTDGTLNSGTFTGSAGDFTTITLAGSYPIPDRGAIWMLSSPSLDGAIYRVMTVTENGPGDFSVVALQHYPLKYALIEDGPLFPNPPTTLLTSLQIPPPTNVTITPWFQPQGGSSSPARITVSWKRPDDKRVIEFELQVKNNVTPWTTVYKGPAVSWDSEVLKNDTSSTYQARVRSISVLGTVSDWATSSATTTPGDTSVPPAPTSLSAIASTQGITVTWDLPVVPDFAYVEVLEATVNNIGSAVLVAQANTNHIIRKLSRDDINAAPTRYYWARTITHSSVNFYSGWTGPAAATSNNIDTVDVINGSITAVSFSSQGVTTGLGAGATSVAAMGHTTVVASSPHLVDISATFTHIGAGASGVSVNLYRDGNLIGNCAYLMNQSFPGTTTFKTVDYPGAGGHTYEIQCNLTAGSTGTTNFENCVMVVTELKR